MKRDARIGLAVVLVFGLAVTLLIGRAIYKRGNDIADKDTETAASSDGSAQYSTEAPRVNGADVTSANTAGTPAPAAAPAHPTTPVAQPAVPQAQPATPPPSAPQNSNQAALRNFVDSNTSRIAAPPSAPLAAPIPEPLPDVAQPHRNAAAPADNRHAPTAGDQIDADHEAGAPPVENPIPADGFGYVVESGDSMWKISTKVYGDGKYTQKIAEANANLKKLKPGAVIHIPAIPHKTMLVKLASFAEASKSSSHSGSRAENRPVAAETQAERPTEKPGTNDAPVADGKATTHKVEAGETIASIAKKYYGFSGPKSVARIVAANKGVDPAKLKVGQELSIPAVK